MVGAKNYNVIILHYNMENTQSMVIYGIIFVSIIVISIGMNQDVTGRGVTIGCIVLACGLALYSIRIMQLLIRDQNMHTKLSMSKILLFLITIVNIGLLAWFIYLLLNKKTLTNHLEIVNYMKIYLQMFLFTVTGIMFINMSILKNISEQPNPNDLFSDQSSNMFFVLAETVILAMYIYIIYIILYSYVTNG